MHAKAVRPLFPTFDLPSGGTVTLEKGVAVGRDPDGRVMLRFDGKKLELCASEDLTLEAPNGGVRIRARDEVTIEARAIRHQADEASVLARRVQTTAQQMVHEVERLEVRAGKIVERAGDVARHVGGLYQQTARRLRTLVHESFTLVTDRTSMRSRGETTVDGDKILLG